MQDGQYFYWQKEVFVEVAALMVGPSKATILEAHKLVYELSLFR